MIGVSVPAMRAVYGSAVIPGQDPAYSVVHFRVDFPAATDAVPDPSLGIIPPDPARIPLPLVVLHPNFNCGPELYRWLSRRLTQADVAVLSFTWVASLFGGRPGLSTGIDLSAVAPTINGTRSPHLILDPLLSAAAALPDLHGCLDLDRVVLGGHSAGGTLALLAASPEWHHGITGAFSYGGHTRAQATQGHGIDAYLPLPGIVPSLLLGGTDDGVVTSIAKAQGQPSGPHPMQVTFDRALPDTAQKWLVLIEGADHYSFAEAYDGSTGRGYLEPGGTADPFWVREILGDVTTDFVRWCVFGDTVARERLDARER